MFRILFLFFLGYITYKMTQFLFLPRRRINLKAKVKRSEAEEMVACARCGTYVARDQAISKNGQPLCSADCSK